MLDIATYAALAVMLLLAHGANARVARLITEDDITQPIRTWAVKRFGEQNLFVRWIHCPWCAGWWTAWAVTAVAWFPIAGFEMVWGYFLAVWSVAHAAGRLNHDHGGAR